MIHGPPAGFIGIENTRPVSLESATDTHRNRNWSVILDSLLDGRRGRHPIAAANESPVADLVGMSMRTATRDVIGFVGESGFEHGPKVRFALPGRDQPFVIIMGKPPP